MIDAAAYLRELNGRTLLTPSKFHALCGVVDRARDLAGDIAEFGVYHGGMAYVLGKENPHKKVHLFDTFTGLPDCSDKDGALESGKFASSLDGVREFLSFREYCWHVGVFPETIGDCGGCTFSLAHVDFDLYAGTREALEFLRTRMTPGGIIVIDDYMYPETPGVTSAVDSFDLMGFDFEAYGNQAMLTYLGGKI